MFDITPLDWMPVLLLSMLTSLCGWLIVNRCMNWYFDRMERKVRNAVLEYERARNELEDCERKAMQFARQLGHNSVEVRLQMIKRKYLLDTMHDYKRRYGKYL